MWRARGGVVADELHMHNAALALEEHVPLTRVELQATLRCFNHRGQSDCYTELARPQFRRGRSTKAATRFATSLEQVIFQLHCCILTVLSMNSEVLYFTSVGMSLMFIIQYGIHALTRVIESTRKAIDIRLRSSRLRVYQKWYKLSRSLRLLLSIFCCAHSQNTECRWAEGIIQWASLVQAVLQIVACFMPMAALGRGILEATAVRFGRPSWYEESWSKCAVSIELLESLGLS